MAARADALIDDFGATLSGAGLVSTTAGRIFALLMMSEEPLSQADIRARLEVSEGSVSEGTRALEALGMVERVDIPKVRRSFFRIHSDAWVNCAEATLTFVQEMNDLALRLERSLAKPSPVVRKQIAGMGAYYALLAQELPRILRSKPTA